MSKQWQTKQQCLMWYGTQESYLQYIHIKLNDQYKQTDVYLLKSIFTSTCIDYSMYFNVFKLSSCFHFHTIHPLCCLHKRTVRLMLKSCVENVIPMFVVTFKKSTIYCGNRSSRKRKYKEAYILFPVRPLRWIVGASRWSRWWRSKHFLVDPETHM